MEIKKKTNIDIDIASQASAKAVESLSRLRRKK